MGGILRDGLHPNADLWRKLYQARLFHPVVVEVPGVASSEVHEAPDVTLEGTEGNKV